MNLIAKIGYIFILLPFYQHSSGQLKNDYYTIEGAVFENVSEKKLKNIQLSLYQVNQYNSNISLTPQREYIEIEKKKVKNRFSIKVFKSSTFELVFSKIGYESSAITFNKNHVIDKKIEISVSLSHSKEPFFIINTKDITTLKDLPQTTILIKDLENKIVQIRKTPEKEKTYLSLDEDHVFFAFKNGYLLQKIEPSLSHEEKKIKNKVFEKTVFMTPFSLKKKVLFKNISFPLYELKMNREIESILLVVYYFLKFSPDIRIELSCHTDTRGDENFNLEISQKRAELYQEALIKRGIKEERIIARGYGEKQIINECKKNVKCSNEKHNENRRIEITIIDK